MSGPIPATELAQLQADYDTLLDLTCVIARRSTVRSSTGGVTTTFTEDVAPVPVRIGTPMAHLLRLDEDVMVGPGADFVATFSATLANPPKRLDRLTHVSDGNVYEVSAVHNAPSLPLDQQFWLTRID